MLIDVGKTSYAVQEEGKVSYLSCAYVHSHLVAAPPASSLFSLRSDFQRFLFGSASPWLLLVFMILMAVSCSRGSSSIVSPPVGNSKNYLSKNGLLSNWGVEMSLKPFCRWILPGKGIPKPSGFKNGKGGMLVNTPGCGAIRCLYICPKPPCGKPHYGAIKCKKRTCPNCYERWLIRSSDSATARLLSKPAMAKHEGLRLGEAYLTIPFEKYPVSMKDFRVLRKEANAYAKSIGFVGGFMVSHPFRTKQHAKDMAYEENVNKWDWVRDQKEWLPYVEISYHFHVIGFFKWLKTQTKDNEWGYGSVTDAKNRPVDLLQEPNPEKRLKQRFKYLLSHAGIPEEEEEEKKFRAFNWFGSCSYKEFGVTEEEKEAVKSGEPPVRRCKLCDTELMLSWDWIRNYYDLVQNGDVEEPEYFFEIQNFMNGEPPPEDAKKFLIDEESG